VQICESEVVRRLVAGRPAALRRRLDRAVGILEREGRV